MNDYTYKRYSDGEILYADEVNKMNNQLDTLTDEFNNSIKIYKGTEPPKDLNGVWINTKKIDQIISNEYIEVIKSLAKRVTELENLVAKIIANGGIIVPDVPDVPGETTINGIVSENDIQLVTESGFYIVPEKYVETEVPTKTVSGITTETGAQLISETGYYIVPESYTESSDIPEVYSTAIITTETGEVLLSELNEIILCQ